MPVQLGQKASVRSGGVDTEDKLLGGAYQGSPDRPDLPPDWNEGLCRLIGMAYPRHVPPQRWHQILKDATRFAEIFGTQAAELGWSTGEVWGCHPRRLEERLDGAGLVLNMRGREIASLDASRAVVVTPSGKTLSIYRRPDDSLRPGERILVWELKP